MPPNPPRSSALRASLLPLRGNYISHSIQTKNLGIYALGTKGLRKNILYVVSVSASQVYQGMAYSLICIKSENSHNFSVIHQNAFKLGHNINHNNFNDNMDHVTYYECFIRLSRNWEEGGEMPYNRYKLKC